MTVGIVNLWQDEDDTNLKQVYQTCDTCDCDECDISDR